jgi:hypothetical protein
MGIGREESESGAAVAGGEEGEAAPLSVGGLDAGFGIEGD